MMASINVKIYQVLRRLSICKQRLPIASCTGVNLLNNPHCHREHVEPLFWGNCSQQIRYYAARKGKREKMEKAKKARKFQEVKKEVITPRKFASKAQLPTRARTSTNIVKEPVDDVWIARHYKILYHTISEGIEMHRETHHPTIFNMPNAPLYLSLELDMSLEKKNKYLDKFSGIVHLPHPFVDGVVKRVLAFCKSEADQNAALAAGADLVGGPSLVKQVKIGEVIPSDYNYIIAHADMVNEISNIRGILKKQYPSTAKGSLGVDVSDLVTRFKTGLEYVAEKDNVSHDFGWIEVPVGPLSMLSEHLEANIGAIIKTVCKHRPTHIGPFVSIALLYSPPSREKFAIDVSKYVPVAPKVVADEDEDLSDVKQ